MNASTMEDCMMEVRSTPFITSTNKNNDGDDVFLDKTFSNRIDF